MKWEFVAADRKTYQGSLSHMNRKALTELADAKEVLVLYDRDQPKANTVYLG